MATASSDILAARIANAAKLRGKPSAARALVNVIPSPKTLGVGIPKFKAWYLLNLDTRETESGQWEPEDIQHSKSANYANSFALNRQRPITQWLHGGVETFSFSARYVALFALQDIQSRVDKLKSWVDRNDELGRPPILYFWIGNQHAKMTSCVITSVSVKYDRPGFLGTMQGATVTIQLQRYDPFSLRDVSNFDTLYYYARVGDTYEMIAARQYKNPMLGVEIRSRHPKQRRLEPGDIVKLPAPTGSIKLSTLAPKSIALRGILNRKSTPQKENLKRALADRSGNAVGYRVT